MSYAFLSIAALIGAILIGIKRKVNIGIVAMFFAFVLSRFVFEGIDVNKLILKGWPLKIFFIMMSAMFLFSFATINGATKLLANKLAYICRNYVKLLPWVFMLATGLLTLCGADPTVIVFMLPIAMLAGQRSRINPIIFCIMLLGAADIGAGSPFSVIGIVTSGLAETAGVHTYLPIWGATAVLMFLPGAIAYFVFGGYKAKAADGELELKKPEPFNKKQKITLAIIGLVLVLILIFKMPIGAAMFTGVALMMLFRVSNDKEAIKSVNWSVLLMVGGTGVLVEAMTQVGGVDMMAGFLSSIMTPSTAAPIMALIAGLMSSVSSATGVVMPTLFPTLPAIAGDLNGTVSIVQLMQGVQSGALVVAFSPLSTLGAMAMASLPQEVDAGKVFTQMIGAAVCSLALAMLLHFTGIFTLLI